MSDYSDIIFLMGAMLVFSMLCMQTSRIFQLNNQIQIEYNADSRALKGDMTLRSAEEMEIMGDLTHSSNPLNNENSTDLLGIVSEGNVIVDYDAHRDSESHDLEIHASIMALDESFEVEDYEEGSDRGTLTIIGGLQQRERGPVGTFNGNGVASGFSKSYSYDQRLASTFPPFYPRVSTFSEIYWKEKPVQRIQLHNEKINYCS